MTDKKNNGKFKGKEDFPHFRKYKSSGHPALIVSEHSEDRYDFRKVKHSEKDGRHNNEKVFPNPNPLDSKPMYIAKRGEMIIKQILVSGNILGNIKIKRSKNFSF